MNEITTYINNIIIQDRDFVYKSYIDSETFKNYNISLINLDITFNETIYKTQPIVYGDINNLKKLSAYLWNQLAQDWLTKPIENSTCYSLKNDILIPELSNMINGSLGKVLDIGSYDGEILYLIQKYKDLNIYEYIGVDIINKDSIELKELTQNQEYVQEDIDTYLDSGEIFDTVFLSMTLLNIFDIEKLFYKISKILTKNGRIYIADINSDSYQARGFFYKKNNEWFLKEIFQENKVFYSLKKLSKKFHTIHAHHPKKLYRTILEQNNMTIQHDYVKGPSKNDILKKCENIKYQKKILNKMSKYIKYPCFHFITAKKL